MTTGSNHETAGALMLKHWPIVIAVSSALLSLGGIYVKLDYIADAIRKSENQYTLINERQNIIGNSIIELRSVNEFQNNELSRHSKEIVEINGKLDLIRHNSRFVPK